MQRGEPGAEHPAAFSRQSIGLPALLRFQWLNPSLPFQPCDGSVQSARPQSATTHAKNILDHGIAVLGPIRQAGHHQQGRVGIVAGRVLVWKPLYYVARISRHVVMVARNDPARKIFLSLFGIAYRSISVRSG